MDKQEMRELFMGIIAENRIGNPKGCRFPACRRCKKWVAKSMTCSVYPQKIPQELFWGKELCRDIDYT